MYDELVKRLREAPSDWPDAELHYEAANAIENTSKAYQMMVEAYEAEVTKPRWIPVTERLPETRTRCVTISKDGDYGLGIYTTDYGWMFPYYMGETTHWMPLPEPPKGET